MTALGHQVVRGTLLALLLVTATRTSWAAEDAESFYVGIGIGVAHISEDATLVDDSSTAYKALFGYELNEYVSLEASFVALDDYEAYSPFVDDTYFASRWVRSQRLICPGRILCARSVRLL